MHLKFILVVPLSPSQLSTFIFAAITSIIITTAVHVCMCVECMALNIILDQHVHVHTCL